MKDRLLSVHEVDALIEAESLEYEIEKVSIKEALGRVLHSPILADRPFPPFDRAMMDGVAVNREAEEFSFKKRGMVAAGQPEFRSLQLRECVEIMTGAVVPKGATHVVPYEEIEINEKEETVIVHRERVWGARYIHEEGADLKKADVLLSEGLRLNERQLAIAASVGATTLEVRQKPRVALLTTGDEVIPPASIPEPHQIRRSHDTLVRGILEGRHLAIVSHEHCLDKKAALHQALQSAVQKSDVVVICGGASKGKYDAVSEVLSELGVCLFHGVLQRPGKPLGLWKLPSGLLCWALPGNPLSVLHAVERHLIPFLSRSAGEVISRRFRVSFECEQELAAPHLTRFMPVRLTEEMKAQLVESNNSGDDTTVGQADGFLEIPSGVTSVNPDQQFDFYSYGSIHAS